MKGGLDMEIQTLIWVELQNVAERFDRDYIANLRIKPNSGDLSTIDEMNLYNGPGVHLSPTGRVLDRKRCRLSRRDRTGVETDLDALAGRFEMRYRNFVI